MTQPTPEAVHLRAAASQLRSVLDWMETAADVLDRTAAQQARQDGHTGAQGAATSPGGPEPTESENGAQAGVQRREPAYDAVYAYIDGLGDHMPPDPVHRNATIWRAVHAALDAANGGRP